MLAFNQFSQGSAPSDLLTWATGPASGPAAPLGQAGGLGRRGAQKMVIFETDGVCSATAYTPGAMSQVYTDNGPYKSFYNVRWDYEGAARNEYPPYVAAASSGGTEPADETIEVVTQLCASDQLASGAGYSSRRKPVRIHCLAFGSLFESTGSAANAQTAINLLQQIQTLGGTQATSPIAMTTGNPKVIIGTASQRISLMQAAFSSIMQDGASVTLIQ
jgi:hypothetical protein